MGIEAFSILMETDEASGALAGFFERRQFVLKKPLPDSPRVVHFEYETNEFIVEASVCSKPSLLPQVRIEFALCNGDGADRFVEHLAAEYLHSFPSEVWFLSATSEGRHFARGDAAGVIAGIRQELPILRGNWTRLFGNRQGPVRISTAYRFVGIS
jgi:hypothetical protein